MNIDGVNNLACLAHVTEASEVTKIWPLPHMYVVKDRVEHFFDNFLLNAEKTFFFFLFKN